MKDLTKEEEVFLSDKMYLPIHYKGNLIEEPFYKGDGCLSVDELQKLCNKFKEYVHQQNVIKQKLKDIVIKERRSKN